MLSIQTFEYTWGSTTDTATIPLLRALPNTNYWVGITHGGLAVGGSAVVFDIPTKTTANFTVETSGNVTAGTVWSIAILHWTTGSGSSVPSPVQPGHFTQKVGATELFTVTLLESDGEPSDLSSIAALTLHVEWNDGTDDDFTMTITDAENGVATYQWATGETNLAGIHRAEVVGTAGSQTYIWPKTGSFILEFTARA